VTRVSLLRNAAASYGTRAAMAGSVLVLTPVLFRGLGVAAFGTWSIVFTFGTVFSLGELGFARGIT
jgi:O-antigen/teichoic acid export membrane protein